MLRDVLKARKFYILLAIAVFYVAWQVWLTIAAPHKVAGIAGESEKVNILVTLPFPPERFHFQRLQAYGRVSGSDEANALEVRGVKRVDLTTVARSYWVRRVEPLKP
jgi:hypothetical protein